MSGEMVIGKIEQLTHDVNRAILFARDEGEGEQMRLKGEPRLKPSDWATPAERERHRSKAKCLDGCSFCLEEKQRREEEAALKKSLGLPAEKEDSAQ